MRIYTLTGDDGTTSLSGGRRVPKYSLRVEAYGSVDELIAWIGLLRDENQSLNRKETLIFIQDQLMRCAAGLAHDELNEKSRLILPVEGCIDFIEKEIDIIEEKLPPLKSFILPGGHVIVSHCHIARCVCRRAERAVLRLNESEKVPDIIYKFLNRISDYLFVLSRIIAQELDSEEVMWNL
jgi:cob(I)alamin adenosyltransferase